MKKSLLATLLLLTVLVLLVSACSSTATPTSTSAASGNDGEVDEVKALIDERCSECHSVNIVYNASYDEARWSELIDEMIDRGADVSDEEKALMIDWLLAQP